MAEPEKKDSSLKEKKFSLDLDIGKDFLSSWKSMSMAEGDAMEFDLPPVSKGSKKAFDFDKADLDFNLDGDFGKTSSFNIDMSDLDISPPLKEVGQSKKNLNESSSGKDKGKNDRFAFAFDFDELENFSFESSLTEGSKAQKDKTDKESSPDGTTSQDMAGSMHMDLIGSKDSLEDGPQKSSLPETEVNFDMDHLFGKSNDVANSKLPSNVAVDGVVTLANSAARDEVESDKRNSPLWTTLASGELQKFNHSENAVSSEAVDLEVRVDNNARQDLSSDCHFNNDPTNASGVQEKVECTGTNATGPNREQNVQMPPIDDITSNNKYTMPENSQHLQVVAITGKNSYEMSEVAVNDHAINAREGIEPGRVNSLVEQQSARGAASGILSNMPSARETRETTSENLKLPSVSQSNDLSEKGTRRRREPLATCLKSFIQSEKLECPAPKTATLLKTFLSSSSKKMVSTQPSAFEGRESDGIQSAKKLVSLPPQLSNSKTLLKKDIPQARSQENYKGLKTSEKVKVDRIQDGKQPRDSSTAQNKDMINSKLAFRQQDISTKDPDTLSSTMEISNKALQNSRNPTALASIPTTKCTPSEEQRLASIDSGKKPPELHVLKLSGLNPDSAKSPIPKDTKSGANISQNRNLLRKAPSDIAHSPDSQKQVPCCLSVKRKTLENDAVNTLHPSKRLSHSLTANSDSVKTSETVHEKKVPDHKATDDDSIKSATGNCQVSTFQIPHADKIRAWEVPFTTDTDKNIKLAEAYGKELDDLCNMLRKKQDEAKELLVRAIVNSNKLVLLNTPAFHKKISLKH